MKKFLKLTTLVVSMVMALTFVSCANGNTSNNGNENSNEEELNLVGTYGISKIENLFKNSTEEQAYTTTMPTSSSLRQYATIKTIEGDTTSVAEIDLTITKTADVYSFNWAKCNIDGVAASETKKDTWVTEFTNDRWNETTKMFAMTITTTAEGTWSNNYTPVTSGTYTVDKANSKVTMTTLISNGETPQKPGIMEATYSNNGKTLVVVQEYSSMTLTRK